ncbi:MAG: hypothetical protein R3C03_18345 [Pirellulaceae bacterium]
MDAVDLLVFRKPGSAGDRKLNQQHFRNIFEVSVRKNAPIKRVVNQLLGKRPFFTGWKNTERIPAELTQNQYDVMFTTPRAVMSLAQSLRQNSTINAKYHVAAVNDIATLAKTKLAITNWRNGRAISAKFHSMKLLTQTIGLRRSDFLAWARLRSIHCSIERPNTNG